MFLVFSIFHDETFVHCVGHPTQCTNMSSKCHALPALPLGTVPLVPTDNESVWVIQPSECLEERKSVFLFTALCLRYA